MDRNDRNITGLVMIAHGMVHTYEMTVPLFVVVWLSEFQTIGLGSLSAEVTTASLGVVLVVGYGLFGLGALPSGVLVDRVGSRRLIAACLLGMGGSFLFLGLAPNMLVIALAFVCWGAAASVYHPAGLSLISTGITERGTGFAYHGVAGNLGIGLGPLVAAILLVFLDWRTVAMVLAVPALVGAVYAFRARFDETAAADAEADSDEGESRGVDSLREFIDTSKLLLASSFVLIFAIAICSGLYYRGVLSFMPELLQGLPGLEPIPVDALLPDSLASALGVEGTDRTLQPEDYLYSGLLLIGVVGQYVGGKLIDRIQVEYGVAGAFGVLAVLAVLFVPVTSLGLLPLFLFSAVLGVFLFMVQPLYQSAVADYTPQAARGLSYGYMYLAVFGVGALGGGIAGGILTFANPTVLFAVLAVFAATAGSIGLFLGWRRAGA